MKELIKNILFEAEYWGTIAGGAVLYCPKTKRFLIALRSSEVMEPHTWGGFGGKLDIDEGINETVEEAVKRELEEETGYGGSISLLPGYVFKDKEFEYHNFIGIINNEFIPQLNWENDDAQWMTFEQLMNLKGKHFGLSTFLKKSKSLFFSLIGNILNENIENNFLPFELLDKLDDWLRQDNNYDPTLTLYLQEHAHLFPIETKKTGSFIYRFVYVKKNDELNLKSGIRSWCNKSKSAENFAVNWAPSSTQADNYILKIIPEQNRVICNLPLLSKTKVFKDSLSYYKSQRKQFSIAIDELAKEDEILYFQPTITKKDIYLVNDDDFNWVKYKQKNAK